MKILGMYFQTYITFYDIRVGKLNIEFIYPTYWCKKNKPFIRIYWDWKLLNG